MRVGAYNSHILPFISLMADLANFSSFSSSSLRAVTRFNFVLGKKITYSNSLD